MTASFPTNFSGVLLFPCKEFDNQNTALAHIILLLSAKQCVPDVYHDQDPLAHRKWVLHSLDCCWALSVQNMLDVVLTNQYSI
jgi:hypothetical protein